MRGILTPAATKIPHRRRGSHEHNQESITAGSEPLLQVLVLNIRTASVLTPHEMEVSRFLQHYLSFGPEEYSPSSAEHAGLSAPPACCMASSTRRVVGASRGPMHVAVACRALNRDAIHSTSYVSENWMTTIH